MLTLIISILVRVYVITDMTLDDSTTDQFMTCDYVLVIIKTLKLVCCFKHLMTWLILFDLMCRCAACCVCIGRHWVAVGASLLLLQAYKCIVSYRIGRYMLGNVSVWYRNDISALSRAPCASIVFCRPSSPLSQCSPGI